jgi:GNAT superfamily N-acetyltransferase
MHDAFLVRLASVDDIPVITRHRAEMFSDMGQLPSTLYADLVTKSGAYLRQAIPAGEYTGWLASHSAEPREIIAGAGVQRRRILPHPLTRSAELRVAHGHQAIVLNVFTEKDWRRKGLAVLLMQHVLDWARGADVETLVLHASDDGRRLYEKLGFVQTNEMRYARPLRET